jgi:hypothetical protein
MKNKNLHSLALAGFIFSTTAFANPIAVRWTGTEDKNSNFNHIVETIQNQTHLNIQASNLDRSS